MNDNSSISESCDNKSIECHGVITPEVVSRINTIKDLWSLARMTRDIMGDPIWEVLNQMGCNPTPLDNIGYNFDYRGFKCIYVPMKKDSGIVRFAIPKLANTIVKSKEKLAESVNMANSLVSESKFTIMGDEVWLIHERHLSENEDYFTLVRHILENLYAGAELFYKIS